MFPRLARENTPRSIFAFIEKERTRERRRRRFATSVQIKISRKGGGGIKFSTSRFSLFRRLDNLLDVLLFFLSRNSGEAEGIA